MLTMQWNNYEGHFYDVMIMYLAFLMRTRGLFFKESRPRLIITGLFLFLYYRPEATCLPMVENMA